MFLQKSDSFNLFPLPTILNIFTCFGDLRQEETVGISLNKSDFCSYTTSRILANNYANIDFISSSFQLIKSPSHLNRRIQNVQYNTINNFGAWDLGPWLCCFQIESSYWKETLKHREGNCAPSMLLINKIFVGFLHHLLWRH